MYRENIGEEEIMSILDDLISRWASERQPNEAFGDFVVRTKVVLPVVNSAKDFYDEPSYSI
jgi:sulfite reductase (NADPH) hemoprotein beta-component